MLSWSARHGVVQLGAHVGLERHERRGAAAQSCDLDLVGLGERQLLVLEIGQGIDAHALQDGALVVHHLDQPLHQGHQDGDLLERLHHATSWAFNISRRTASATPMPPLRLISLAISSFSMSWNTSS